MLASLSGSASLDASLPTASLPGFIGCTPDPEVGLLGSIVPLAGVLEQLRPRARVTQWVELRLVASLPIGDVTLILSDLSDAFSWEEGLTDAVAFSFSVPASFGDWVRGPLGYETNWGAPPPGLSALRLELVYTTAAGAEVAYRLVTNGIAVKSKRSISRDGHVLSIDALGTWGRYDRKRVTLSLPPSHGKTQGQVARSLAVLAGVPAPDIAVSPSLGEPRGTAIDIVREEFRSTLTDVGDSLVMTFDFDRDARFVAFDLAPDAPPEWIFTLDQLAAASSLDLEADGEVVTCITITGTSPELPGDALGSVTTFESVDTYSIFSVPAAWLRQQPGGSLTVPGGTPGPLPPTRLLTGRVLTQRTTIGGCLHEEQVITYAYSSPEAARYTIASDGTLTAIPNVYIYDAGAVSLDGAKAYLWQRHRFVEISRVITRYVYDETSLELNRTLVYRRAWFNPPAALKHRTVPTDTWELTDYINGTRLLGGGSGVLYNSELYFSGWDVEGAIFINPSTLEITQARSTEFTVNRGEDAKLLREEKDQRDFVSPDGGEYLYQQNSTPSLLPEFRGGESGSVETIYSARLSGGLTTISTTFDATGAFTGQTITKVDGDRPAMPRCDASDEARKSGRPWSVGPICAGIGGLVGKEESRSSDWIETEAEAAAFTVRYLRRSQALTATLVLPVNAALRRGMPISLRLPEAGIDMDGWIEKHAISKGGRRDPILSTVTLRLRTF